MRTLSVFMIGVDTKGSRGIPYGLERGALYLGGMRLGWSEPSAAIKKGARYELAFTAKL